MGFQLGAQLSQPCSKIRLPSAGHPGNRRSYLQVAEIWHLTVLSFLMEDPQVVHW